MFSREQKMVGFMSQRWFSDQNPATRKYEISKDNYHKLQFSPEVDVKIKTEIKNPKRRLKETKKEICQRGQAQKLRSFEKTTR